ncbi:MAG: UDP-N-acetylmuramoyl-L-alanyl-D-glutamate--2,6-diaminopimelate ligase [Rickettsia endosymbiont of Bryobia graminum]|nr:UDP-N-acetylmuramoyl-L-alanyl-D-glutamate--2,6-diaminopimelate ligase [Rickettsia endosymbiont of Bryobia graminum]
MAFNYFLDQIQSQKITGLSCDSRLVQTGNIFFALQGINSNGNKFIDQVIEKGIKFIVTDDPCSLENPNIFTNQVNIALVSNARAALIEALKILYPLLPKHIVSATGTNGKSSVVSYCRQLYSLLGQSSASIGTIGVECSKDIPVISKTLKQIPSLTTPDLISIRHILHILAENQVNYIAFEASSHGLDQGRLEGIKTHAACFTSFSQDHLDYHQNMDAYLLAKLSLFTNNLLPSAFVIINSEIEQSDFIKNYLQQHDIKFLTVGTNGDVNIINTNQSVHGQDIKFTYQNKQYNFNTKIIGSFQASNLLIATLMVHITGFPFEDIITKLPEIQAVKGRLERVTNDLNQGYSCNPENQKNIFIDYAHTPDALEKTLLELKKIKPVNGLLKVIFGCGGDRDSSKRPKMGEIASKIADQLIITDDNPRTEQPNLIRQQIIQGVTNSNYLEIADRETAITQTIDNLQKEDILLIAGKGHEDYQIIGTQKLPFSDFEVAKKILSKLSNINVFLAIL